MLSERLNNAGLRIFLSPDYGGSGPLRPPKPEEIAQAIVDDMSSRNQGNTPPDVSCGYNMTQISDTEFQVTYAGVAGAGSFGLNWKTPKLEP